jgi:hypothetical protein
VNLDPRTAGADDLLQALTVGDLTADDPAVAARLAQDPALRARWRELASTLAALRELDGGLRDEPGDGAGEAAARAAAAAAVRGFRGAPRPRPWLVVVVAAAAMLTLVLWLTRPEPPAPPDPNLGGGATGVLIPDGDWPADAPFRWPAVPRAAGYRVQVQLPDGSVRVLPNGADGELLPATEWRPAAAQRAALPEQFTWRVLAFDASGDLLGTSAPATARQR